MREGLLETSRTEAIIATVSLYYKKFRYEVEELPNKELLIHYAYIQYESKKIEDG